MFCIRNVLPAALLLSSLAMLPITPSMAGDAPMSSAEYRQTAQERSHILTMPKLKKGEYGTNVDNEDNAGTHNPDGDMDTYLFNSDSNTPIEFNITVPATEIGKPATLRMDVYDVDADSGEVDKVYVNGTEIGVLNGHNGEWGVNIFAVPAGVLVAGRNLVKIDIDTANPGNPTWAVTVDWGIIKTDGVAAMDITRAWVAPVRQNAGNYVNFFAEVNAKMDAVTVTISGNKIELTDPDGDKVWSGQWQIPSNWGGKNVAFTMAATVGGKVVSQWPRLLVTK